MMHDLVIPFARTGLEIETDEALAVEIVARAMSTVVVARRRFDGQIDESQILVHRDLRPDAGVAGVLGRSVEPRLGSRLALLRNRVEGPEALASAHVEAADVAFVVPETLRRRPFAKRRADDDHVAPHHRRALKSDLAGYEVGHDRLIDVRLEVDGAVGAKARDSRAALGVECDQPIARCDIENSFFAPVGPIREAAPGELARRGGPSLAFVLAMDPLLRARRRIQCDDGAIRSAGCV